MQRRVMSILCGITCMIVMISCNKPISSTQISGQIEGFEDWKNTTENMSSGGGYAYYYDGFLYYVYGDDIYEYDLFTDEVVKFNKISLWFPSWLSRSENGILFTQNFGSEIKEIAFDTQELSTYYQMDSSRLMNWYLEDDILFGQHDGSTDLFRFNMITEQKEMLAEGEVIDYCLDGDNIYFVGGLEQREYTDLYIMSDESEIKKVDLELNPIMVSAEGDRVVLADFFPYQLYEYTVSTGECKKIDSPTAQSCAYQLVNNYLYYTTYVNPGKFPVICMIRRYDFETGEDIIVWEAQQDDWFSVFDERSVFTRDRDGKPVLLQVIEDEVKVLPLPVWGEE